eukprot:CAMPEP_0205812312 /NCGR_PEP_ID=MMETSP0205-20121125/16730_1 /ASSEMBLY_ACC=CAM_ASM_000278 /TAXON_ID=36767 /ORGANISM="Euplotes focardii, Strain TN1" /LENGTH=106 /DNA_ID=CAMNT_0053092793 /DNA_START=374 /DNA_END=691 /DNA_ORIENTATION=+
MIGLIVLAVLVFSFINPLFEEFYWRVFTLETFSENGKTNGSWAKWGTTIGYGAYHFWILYLESGVLGGIGMALAAILFGYVLFVHQQKTGIFSSYMIHSSIDIGQI